MKTDKILNKINNTEIIVNKNLDVVPDRGSYIREFNKGKSFEFSEWKPLTKYTNDCFKQDFVSYENALLACNKTHVSEEPPVLKYENEVPVGVTSEEWIFVFSAGVTVLNGEFSITIDEEMSDTSKNAVQNKVVKEYIDKHPQYRIIEDPQPYKMRRSKSEFDAKAVFHSIPSLTKKLNKIDKDQLGETIVYVENTGNQVPSSIKKIAESVINKSN